MIIPISILTGILIGVLAGLLLVIVILKVTKKDGSIKCRYDERQEKVRGRGFKYGFFALLIYNCVVALIIVVVDSCEGKRYVDDATLMLFGILFGVFIYASYCIWNEAYFSLNENRGRVFIAFAVIALVNFIIAAVNIMNGTMMKNGVLTFQCMNLLCGIMLVLIILEQAVKSLCDKEEEA